MGQEERWQERRSSRGLGMDKKRDEKWNARRNTWRLGDETEQSFLRGWMVYWWERVWPWVVGDGNNVEAPLFQAFCKWDKRWCNRQSLSAFCPHTICKFAFIIWMRPKETSGQNKYCLGQIDSKWKTSQDEERGFQWKISQLLTLKLSKSSL